MGDWSAFLKRIRTAEKQGARLIVRLNPIRGRED